MPHDSLPILAEITRGPLVESRHIGSAVVMDTAGGVVAEWGDGGRLTFPRSSNKLLQALPLIESGAAERFGVSPAELSLACASHRGEPRHVEAVLAWLTRMGLPVDMLECGSHWPFDEAAAFALARAGGTPTQAHNNCSGKHTGFLATALHLGEPLAGYADYDHPVQRRITETLSAMMDIDLFAQPWGIDGCSIPTIAAPLQNLALAMAKCADPSRLPDGRAEAIHRLVEAMATQAFYMDGTQGFATRLMDKLGAKIVCKVGAEGVFTAILREHGWGVALKVEDGTPRGAEMALVGVLRALGVLTDADAQDLADVFPVAIKTRRGLAVGDIRPVALEKPGAF